MKVRVIKNLDGSIGIVFPAPKSRKKDENEEVWLDRVLSKSTPPNVDWVDIDSEELPKERKDRNAWELKDGKVRVNVEKKNMLSKRIEDKKALRTSALSKMGLTEEEFKALNLK